MSGDHKVTFAAEKVKKDDVIRHWYNKKASFMDKAPEDGVIIQGDGPGSSPVYLRDSDLKRILATKEGVVKIQSWGTGVTLDFDVVK